jgi:hypothetical protein
MDGMDRMDIINLVQGGTQAECDLSLSILICFVQSRARFSLILPLCPLPCLHPLRTGWLASMRCQAMERAIPQRATQYRGLNQGDEDFVFASSGGELLTQPSDVDLWSIARSHGEQVALLVSPAVIRRIRRADVY